MKVVHLGCKTIKDGITTASVFLITGLCLILVGNWILPELWYLPQIIIFTGMLILLMVPVILIATYLKNR